MKWYSLILFFYVYGFLGWIYESILVSVRSKKLVNRGFVKGPILPIYGLGASCILMVTTPVEQHPIAVFFIGMASATALEYVSGYLLERIFKVRYWDYTGYFANLKGYICLASVLVWGIFSLFMVYFLHRHIEEIINKIPDYLIYIILVIVTIVFIYDLCKSVKEAYDIKELHMRIESIYNEIKADSDAKLEKYREELEAVMEKAAARGIAVKKRNPKARMNIKYKNILAEIKENIKSKN